MTPLPIVKALTASVSALLLTVIAPLETLPASDVTQGVRGALGAGFATAPNQYPSTIESIDSGTGVMPGNPSIPLPTAIASIIGNDATLIAPNYALTAQGELKDLSTGNTVTDPKLVGTADTPPDQLALTQGSSFIPVSVGAVRTAMQAKAPATAASVTTQASLENNEYGAHWGTYNGSQAFFERSGKLFAQQAKGVIDVSSWQGDIDWSAVKRSGVQGAIIRIGSGDGLEDGNAEKNIAACKKLGIPFGIYLYSYAYDANYAKNEAASILTLLKKAGVKPADLSYPVFYDLERWVWKEHSVPTSTATYDDIVNTWFATMKSGGYSDLSVYSYLNYLQTSLNTSNIHAKTRWVAQYGSSNGFSYPTNWRGWQYTSEGSVQGISGNVDLNAFGNASFVQTEPVYPAGVGYYVSNSLAGGKAATTFAYGTASDTVLVGDWNGDGKDTLAVRRGKVYYIKNSLGGGQADTVIGYGNPSDQILVGDWNGDGKDTLAVRRGKVYYIKNSIAGGAADSVIAYGTASDTVLVGDWNGDGKDTLAVRRDNVYYFKNSISGGRADAVTGYGKPTDLVLDGDWNGDRASTLMVRRNNAYYAKNSIRSGAADITFAYGRSTDQVLVGDWNGDGTDTLAIRR